MSVGADHIISVGLMPLKGYAIKRPEFEDIDDRCQSFDKKFVNNIAKWGARSIPAYLADSYYTGFKDNHLQQLYGNAHAYSSLQDFKNNITNKLKHYPTNALPYKQLLGIDTGIVKTGSQYQFKNYRSLVSTDG